MPRRLASRLALLVLAPLLAGCGTWWSSMTELHPPGGESWPLGPIYGGVVADVTFWLPGCWRDGEVVGVVFFVLDLPLSLAADTLLLPLTLPAGVGWWGVRTFLDEERSG